MRWLCIETHFLAGRYHGRSEEGRQHQWPPNPHRLLQALVAAGTLGFRRAEFSDAKKEALRWLERRSPPEIVAPREHQANTIRLYVPNNDMDKVARAWAKNVEPEKQPNELRTGKSLRPHHVYGDATVRFLWSVPDEEWAEAQPHADRICAEARHMHTLGLGIDLVAGNGRILSDVEKRALPGEVWVADAEGAGWWAPTQGSLDEVLARHVGQTMRVRAGIGRSAGRWVRAPGPPTVLTEVGYVRRTEGRHRPVYVFELIDEEGRYCSFDPRQAIKVAAWLRHAAHECARGLKQDAEFVERFVCGHGDDAASKNNRFSYLPLPTISPRGRDGRIRRVLLAEPFVSSNAKAQALARRLSGASLAAEGTGEIMADLRALSKPLADGVSAKYLQKARRWGSVTPVVLPGRDDRRSRKAYGLVLKALAQAGYTTPVEELHLQAEPIFPGAETATSYRLPAYLREFPRTHVIITFAEALEGPVAIGGGRHSGLGIFAALS